MSKKESKKMTPIHTKYPKASTGNITRVELSEVFHEVQGIMMMHPELFKEIKRTSATSVEIPGVEVAFPLVGNLFMVELLQRGDIAAEPVADFALCLFNKYTTREFHFTEESKIVFAVDAPVDEVSLIWDTVMQVYGFKKVCG